MLDWQVWIQMQFIRKYKKFLLHTHNFDRIITH